MLRARKLTPCSVGTVLFAATSRYFKWPAILCVSDALCAWAKHPELESDFLVRPSTVVKDAWRFIFVPSLRLQVFRFMLRDNIAFCSLYNVIINFVVCFWQVRYIYINFILFLKLGTILFPIIPLSVNTNLEINLVA
jgi:hypothetical protein